MTRALYTYFRSSASWRVRIALALKGLSAEHRFIHLRRNEQSADTYRDINDGGLVPTLIDGEALIAQSVAAIEYLDESYPDPPLLPKDPATRAHVRSVALAIACDLHPLNNLRVLRYLLNTLDVGEAAKDTWYRHWVEIGFETVERMLARSPHTGRFCCGAQPGLADCVLVPQVYNAERFDCDLSAYPTIMRINADCLGLPAFAETHPSRQGDTET